MFQWFNSINGNNRILLKIRANRFDLKKQIKLSRQRVNEIEM